MNLKDKICLITGGASGIGLEIAHTFAKAGGKIVIADINAEAADKAARGLGDGHMGVAMDVTDEIAVQRGVAKAIETYGRVDVLLSNAGIQMVKRIEEFSYDVYGPPLLCKGIYSMLAIPVLAVVYPACWCSVIAAGLDGFRGSAARQMGELTPARIVSRAFAEPRLPGSAIIECFPRKPTPR